MAGGETSAAFPPGKWTLAQREHWQDAYKEAQQYVDLANQSCGTQIEFHYDHESLRPIMAEDTGLNSYAKSFASDVAGIIKNLCASGKMQKQAVATNIKVIVIGRPGDKKHRLDAGTLVGAVDENANPRQYYYDFEAWLKSAL